MAKQRPREGESVSPAFSRRSFLKTAGVGAAASTVVGVAADAVSAPRVLGPDAVPLTLKVNGAARQLTLEPRVTLLDALRDNFDLTGAKRVCDRGECGACTVLLDGKPVYACNVLAIDAQGKAISTVESLGAPGNLHPVQQAFVEHDATQCGFCTPGFIVASKALLDKHPNPTPEQIRHGLAGNFCRCGTYVGMRAALAAGRKGA